MCNSESINITNQLPAILIGGVKHAGKSVLTYNLTRELRERKIPHYVLRASPDGEGDWYFETDENVRQLIKKGEWTDHFRELVCRDISNRQLPLIVDIGGRPQEQDQCIFRACTHSIMLLKDGAEDVLQTWSPYTTANDLTPLAEVHSRVKGSTTLTSHHPIIKGSIVGLERGRRTHGETFNALVTCISQIFSSYSQEELEKRHLDKSPIELIVHLGRQLAILSPGAEDGRWTPDQIQPLLSAFPAQTPLAVYGRGPAWLYGALALHAGEQNFYQFDTCLNWIEPPVLQSSTAIQPAPDLMHIETWQNNGTYVLTVRLSNHYIDNSQAHLLAFPEPPPQCGVIIDGKLPLWLFTALSRFYAQRNVPWIAINDLRFKQIDSRKACVIYSQTPQHTIGDLLNIPG